MMVFEATADEDVDPSGREKKGKSSRRVWGKITGGKRWMDRWTEEVKTRAESHMKSDKRPDEK